MKLLNRLLFRGFALALAISVFALPPASADQLTAGMQRLGVAKLKVMFWDVYEAKLYSTSADLSWDAPFALSLTYLRDLKGEKIAERSITEIRSQASHDETTLARWYELLVRIIPDVDDKTEITGLYTPSSATQFFRNGEFIGEINEPGFSQAFFSIWLGEQTSRPELRRQLLGER